MTNDNIKMVPATCSQCGGKISVDPSQEKIFCKYCGTSLLVEKAIHNYEIQNAKIERVESININKRGAVESVLNFVEKQQDKKQKKIDDEKQRQEEARILQEEKMNKVRDQIVNVKYLKRNLFVLGIAIIAIIMLSIIENVNNKGNHYGEVKTPSSSDYYEGKDYKDAVNEFEEKGFVNVKTETVDDLITGLLTKDGEVESISVDGDIDYSANAWYSKEVEVVILYHTFPTEETTETEDTVETERVKFDEKTENVEVAKEDENTGLSEETESEIENTKPEENNSENYTETNLLINQDLLQNQGWAIGTLDADGNPTSNGTPNPAFAFSLYIENITYLGDKLRVSVVPEFEKLPDDDKKYVINTVQNIVNSYTNDELYTTIYVGENAIGNSEITNVSEFKW